MSLSLEGELSVVRANELKELFIDYVKTAKDIELDLSSVSEIDTAGFQLLVALKKESDGMGRNFRILSVSPAVENLLDLYNVKDMFI
ncbi:MAG: STAS domain-containing protein [Nitrospirae bacterium]|nr:STAS domain-containing protein [Nitrospirota bacterium]MBF0535469.1 STAS domain-containing protein [Nitrospirota bacterium]MBF0617399.1 STAS domain-containing protein [Nitrospirota bacterium]